MIRDKAAALALAFVVAGTASAQTVNVSVQLKPGEPEETVPITCTELGDTSNPNVETFTRLASAIHGYDGDVYFDKAARARAIDAQLSEALTFNEASIRRALGSKYRAFDSARENEDNRGMMSAVIGNLRIHDVTPTEINGVLVSCRGLG